MTRGSIRYKHEGKQYFVKYKTPGTRKSGDANTSVGNTFVNMVVHHAIL